MMFKDWKSSANGILSFVIATCSVLTAFTAAQLAVNPSGSKIWVGLSTGCALASALAKAWIGLITTNADAGAVAKALEPLTPAPTVPPTAPPVPNPAPAPTAASLAASPKP